MMFPGHSGTLQQHFSRYRNRMVLFVMVYVQGNRGEKGVEGFAGNKVSIKCFADIFFMGARANIHIITVAVLSLH